MNSMADCRSFVVEDCNSSAEETRTQLMVSRTVVTMRGTGVMLSLLTSESTAQHPAWWSEQGKLGIGWCDMRYINL